MLADVFSQILDPLSCFGVMISKALRLHPRLDTPDSQQRFIEINSSVQSNHIQISGSLTFSSLQSGHYLAAGFIRTHAHTLCAAELFASGHYISVRQATI